MVRRLPQVLYTPTSRVNDQCIAVIACDSSLDTDWITPTEGSDNTGAGDTVIAKYAIVDNLVNQNSCNITFGLQSYGVAPYTRRTFALPELSPTVEIKVSTGIVVLTLCQNNMQVPDEINQLASSGGNTVGEYNPFFFCTGQTPVANQVLFTHYFEEAVQYQPNFNGFQGGIDRTHGTNPAATYNCPVYKNGLQVGNLAYQTGGTVVATTTGGTTGTYAVGDCMTVAGNATPDGSIVNFSGTFAMTPV